MHSRHRSAAAAVLLTLVAAAVVPLRAQPAATPTSAAAPPDMPAVAREFRGVWVATVGNMDWPSSRELSVEEQQAELLALLDRARRLNLNAVIFQVRPAADALYDSPHEPWSHFLTGRQGRAPVPYWDPLRFAVTEAHRRGMELHAWFNPFRAGFVNTTSPAAANHVSRRRPELVRRYGSYYWMDPGMKASHDLAMQVVRDVV
ncbi:MAG TPA: family 10 glycosylhydrolase, partial [Gemmatimonadaceae bacterium]|nr:family 10 glycosylhydrolase [Gemmatimonadaceae bacterium]